MQQRLQTLRFCTNNEIKTQKGSNERLFILTRTHRMHIFRGNPLRQATKRVLGNVLAFDGTRNTVVTIVALITTWYGGRSWSKQMCVRV